MVSGAVGRRRGPQGETDFYLAEHTRHGYNACARTAASADEALAAAARQLLDEPLQALRELDRVCRPGGRLIIPTYMNRTDKGTTNRVSGAIGRAGADFKREFTLESYQAFFAAAGYTDARYTLCEGRIPCAVAVLQKRKEATA